MANVPAIGSVGLITAGTGKIRGNAWDDADGDGEVDGGESGVEDWRIYIDANNSGAYETGETSTRTDANGDYELASLPDGIHRVRFVRSGYTASIPTVGYHDVKIGDSQVASDRNFGCYYRP